jgi:hypothetical protein
MPPISTTLAKLVAKFAAGVVDTGGKFATGVNDYLASYWSAGRCSAASHWLDKFANYMPQYFTITYPTVPWVSQTPAASHSTFFTPHSTSDSFFKYKELSLG